MLWLCVFIFGLFICFKKTNKITKAGSSSSIHITKSHVGMFSKWKCVVDKICFRSCEKKSIQVKMVKRRVKIKFYIYILFMYGCDMIFCVQSKFTRTMNNIHWIIMIQLFYLCIGIEFCTNSISNNVCGFAVAWIFKCFPLENDCWCGPPIEHTQQIIHKRVSKHTHTHRHTRNKITILNWPITIIIDGGGKMIPGHRHPRRRLRSIIYWLSVSFADDMYCKNHQYM